MLALFSLIIEPFFSCMVLWLHLILMSKLKVYHLFNMYYLLSTLFVCVWHIACTAWRRLHTICNGNLYSFQHCIYIILKVQFWLKVLNLKSGTLLVAALNALLSKGKFYIPTLYSASVLSSYRNRKFSQVRNNQWPWVWWLISLVWKIQLWIMVRFFLLIQLIPKLSSPVSHHRGTLLGQVFLCLFPTFRVY